MSVWGGAWSEGGCLPFSGLHFSFLILFSVFHCLFSVFWFQFFGGECQFGGELGRREAVFCFLVSVLVFCFHFLSSAFCFLFSSFNFLEESVSLVGREAVFRFLVFILVFCFCFLSSVFRCLFSIFVFCLPFLLSIFCFLFSFYVFRFCFPFSGFNLLEERFTSVSFVKSFWGYHLDGRDYFGVSQ